MDVEKDILKSKAHEKLTLQGNPARTPGGNANSSAGQDGVPNQLSAKTKHNRRQRALYNKHRKAKKAQQKAQINQKQNANVSQAPATAIKSDQ